MIAFIKYLLVLVIGYVVGRYHFETQKDKEEASSFKITKLSTREDGESYFEEIKIETGDSRPLGNYSEPHKVKELYFRNSVTAKTYDLHRAPKEQFIIYLSGSAEVETSLGVKRLFNAGDILLAADTTGKGHTSTVKKDGKALVVTVE